jgi:hypothetical protein
MPTPRELIKQLEKLPEQDRQILCQVVPEDGPGAWNMFFEFHDAPEAKLIQLKVYHPDLKTLPKIG